MPRVLLASVAVHLACDHVALLQQQRLGEVQRSLSPVRLLLNGRLSESVRVWGFVLRGKGGGVARGKSQRALYIRRSVGGNTLRHVHVST